MLFGASITAVLVKYSFPYNWSWVECLLFGAIFSATDPVAVVAVLKEVKPCTLHGASAATMMYFLLCDISQS